MHQMEEADDTRLLREMAPELERLRAQLEDLRKQFQVSHRETSRFTRKDFKKCPVVCYVSTSTVQ